MYCRNCGTELPDPNQQFCPNCGIPLKYQNMIDFLKKNSEIIAGAVIKDTRIIYTTDNWDISGDIDRLLSSWSGQNAQFIMLSGVKYSVLQIEAERLVAMSYKGEGSIVATKDDDYIIILQVNSEKSKNGNFPFPDNFNPLILKSVEKKIKSIMKTESINELTIERQYLPEIFGADVLEISKDDGLPVLEPFVISYLLSKGIFTDIFGNIIKLKKVRPLKGYHQEGDKLLTQMFKSKKKIRKLKSKIVGLRKRHKNGESVSDLFREVIQVMELLFLARIQKRKATLEFKRISEFILIHESDREYWEEWNSHNRCQKNLKPSCEECLDVEKCKRNHKYNMLEYQLKRKREGEISLEFDTWFEQELEKIDLDSIPPENFKLIAYKIHKKKEKRFIFKFWHFTKS